MGLLDNIVGTSIDDPKTMATMQLVQGLLSPGGAMRGISSGLLGYGQQMAQAKQQALMQQMHDLQLQQAKRQAAMQEMQDKFRASIPSPTMQAAQAALSGGGGTTLANAAKMAPVNPEAEFMHGAMQANLIDPVQYIQAQRKDTAPLISKAGDVARDPRTGKVLWQNDDKDKTPEAIRAIEAVYGANSPQAMQAKQAYIQKMTTHQPGVSVSYGAPVAGVDAQGNPVFFQPDKSGGKPAIIPGVAPPKKDVPAAMQEKFATNAVTLNKIDKALSLVDKNPDALGLKNYLGDTVMQRVDPAGIELRAMVADIGGQKIHDRSGAAVTVGESARLKPYIPAATDSPETVKRKLVLFRNEYAAMQQALNSGASISQAAASPASPMDGWSIKPVGGN